MARCTSSVRSPSRWTLDLFKSLRSKAAEVSVRARPPTSKLGFNTPERLPDPSHRPGSAPIESVELGAAPALRAADHLIDHLVTREHVDVFFGLPGGAISPLEDALRRRTDARMITTRHEADAVYAAAGYARATGRIGVAMVTSGPGALNAVNALASAHLEGLPVLLLAGEAPLDRAARGALQEGGIHGLDLLHLARSITKVTAQLTDENAALPQLLAVVAQMKSGRQGAGLVTCPVNVTRGPARRPDVFVPPLPQLLLDEASLDRAAELVVSARRPLIFAGNGCRGGDGPTALRAFAERLQAPVITTPHGKGVFPENHPLALGVFGLAQHPSAVAFLEAGFDCMLAVGTGLSELATNGWSPLLKPSGEGATMIQIDVDASRLGRVYPVDLAVIGLAAPALRSIANRFLPQPRRVFGIERKSNPEAFPVGPEGRITPQRALWEVQRAMPAETRYTCDSGEHTLYALHYLEINDARTFHVALGLASMGSGIGTALGLAAAPGGSAVVAICGDGGFLMSTPAIACAAHAKLPVVFVVMNDGQYGMCEIGYKAVYGASPGFKIDGVDLVRVSEGLGARAFKIDGPDKIRDLDLAALTAAGPIVLDIEVDREVRMVSNARLEIIEAQKPHAN